MSKLPYSRTINVTLSRNGGFPSRAGFGVALVLTTVAVAGELDATHLTKVYGSMEEVADDHASNTEVYAAMEAAFSQNPAPLQVKAGYIDFDPDVDLKADLKTALDLIEAADNSWYWLTITASMRDKANLDGIVEWVEARHKQACLDSNDVLTESAADATCLAARHKNTVERTSVFYHNDAAEYPAIAFVASLGTRNFDQAGSAYTGKYKKLLGVSDPNLGSAAVQAVTGFTPELGQSAAAGHMANTITTIGDQPFVSEGSTLTQNVFIDEVHATDWIIARTQEETLGILLKNDRIPYTDTGMEQLASGARTVMRVADNAGLIGDNVDPLTGLYRPAVEYEIPSVRSVPEAQRKNRIAPAIKVTFLYAGAVHYATIAYRMTF